MSSVFPGDSSVVFMRKKFRRLTASASVSVLSDNDVDTYLNNVILNDFPYAIKIDQMRSVYTFFTEPYRDRYPIDVNYNQGIRAPVYVEGIAGSFYKDRAQFFNLWPRFPTLFQPIAGNGIQTVFPPFTIPGPFLSKEVVLGGVDVNGNPISVNDDGNGNLLLQVPNAVTTLPIYNQNGIPPIPGMHNQNTGNPGLNYQGTETGTFTNCIGNVNYVTGVFNITFPVAPAAGQNITLWVSQYQTGRPYCLLFWNNELTIRPVPKLIHKVEVETFLTPIQFMNDTDVPILNQWAQYIAYTASMEALRDRQDTDGVEALREGMMRQEGLVLERQGVEEIFQATPQLFNSTYSNGVNGGFGQGGFW